MPVSLRQFNHHVKILMIKQKTGPEIPKKSRHTAADQDLVKNLASDFTSLLVHVCDDQFAVSLCREGVFGAENAVAKFQRKGMTTVDLDPVGKFVSKFLTAVSVCRTIR
jgi:hypothetical protein